MEVQIKRIDYSDKQVLGELTVDGFACKTLELADKENQRRISCIPKGTYKVIKRFSAKYGNHFWIQNVPNRSMILIHQANYHFQLLGCIAVGEKHTDINKDGYRDVTSSVATMNKLNQILPNEFTLKIV